MPAAERVAGQGREYDPEERVGNPGGPSPGLSATVVAVLSARVAFTTEAPGVRRRPLVEAL